MQRVHCSYHKCLTVFVGRVLRATFNRALFWSGGYQHFNSRLPEFLAASGQYRVASVNNHFLDPAQCGDGARITRFVRDPRDLVVSGYFYHRKGSEPWCRTPSPTAEDFRVVNGVVPSGVRPGESFTEFLQRVSLSEGLIAEIEFRRRHFESMLQWPAGDPRVRLFRYEDVIGREVETVDQMVSWWGGGVLERAVARRYAAQYALGGEQAKRTHVRDPRPGQWARTATPDVQQYFDREWGPLLAHLGY